MGSQRVGHDWATELSECLRTSPVVQWLRIHLVVWGMWVWSLVGKLGSHKLRRNSLYTTTTEPVPQLESPWVTTKDPAWERLCIRQGRYAARYTYIQDIHTYTYKVTVCNDGEEKILQKLWILGHCVKRDGKKIHTLGHDEWRKGKDSLSWICILVHFYSFKGSYYYYYYY